MGLNRSYNSWYFLIFPETVTEPKGCTLEIRQVLGSKKLAGHFGVLISYQYHCQKRTRDVPAIYSMFDDDEAGTQIHPHFHLIIPEWIDYSELPVI